MSKLENIVPPLELCKQIPAGEFEESALVWEVYHYQYTIDPYVISRETSETTRGKGLESVYPAPTLAEILAELPEAIDTPEDEFFSLSVRQDFGDDGKPLFWIGYNNTCEKDANPAAAALRLWLRIRRKAGR